MLCPPPLSFSLFSVDPNFKNPYVQQFNLGIQRDLGWNSILEISYAGSKGTRLYEFRHQNQATPTADATSPIDSRRQFPFIPGTFALWCSCDSSTYHSLQVKLEKRLSNGLSFLGAYTFGKAIDEMFTASLNFLAFFPGGPRRLISRSSLSGRGEGAGRFQYCPPFRIQYELRDTLRARESLTARNQTPWPTPLPVGGRCRPLHPCKPDRLAPWSRTLECLTRMVRTGQTRFRECP